MITQMTDVSSYMDRVALYQYVLKCIHDELRKISYDCDHCDAADRVRRKLEALVSENGLSIRLTASDFTKK